MSSVLIIDDEEAVCWSLERALSREGHRVATAVSVEQGWDAIAKQTPDAIVLDVRLPGTDGLTALGRFRERLPDVPILIITAFGNLDTAVRAVEGGAFDYLTKPFDLGQALDVIHRALRHTPAPEESAAAEPVDSEALIGASPAIQAVFKRIALVAAHEACVLITGESGTGKELVARALHRHSKRKHGPFLPVHVAALNPNLVESELFGHVKGAFTGAAQSRPGLLALANGGTVFLDEVAEIPLHVQVKLLRVLEHNEVFPVGSTQPQPLNLRILAATHQDLSRRVAEGAFRQDLFFRLNVFQVELPPLRERLEDIPRLAEHFLARFGASHRTLQSDTVKFLQGLPWIGNIRELRNAIEHAAIVARGEPLQPEHFPRLSVEGAAVTAEEQIAGSIRRWLAERLQAAGKEPPHELYQALLKCVEPALLEDVMRRVTDNRWVAAQWLGLNRATVRKKLKEYGLTSVTGNGPEEGDDHDA